MAIYPSSPNHTFKSRPLLTLLMLKTEHSWQMRTVTWLLMPWLLSLPDLQQLWYRSLPVVNSCPPNVSLNWVSIGSGNGLSPVQRQAITWTNAGLLSTGPLGTIFHEIWIKIQKLSFMKMHLNLSSAQWRPFCPGGDELSKINGSSSSTMADCFKKWEKMQIYLYLS